MRRVFFQIKSEGEAMMNEQFLDSTYASVRSLSRAGRWLLGGGPAAARVSRSLSGRGETTPTVVVWACIFTPPSHRFHRVRKLVDDVNQQRRWMCPRTTRSALTSTVSLSAVRTGPSGPGRKDTARRWLHYHYRHSLPRTAFSFCGVRHLAGTGPEGPPGRVGQPLHL